MKHSAPLKLWREVIQSEWTDYNQHMNVAYYTLVFDHAVDVFFSYVGLGKEYREATKGSTFAVEHHITYDREVVEGDEVYIESQLIGFDEKRLHHYHEMYNVNENYLASTCEFLSLHVDLSTRRVAPIPVEKLRLLSEVAKEHQSIQINKNLGSIIKIPKPKN